MTLFIKVGYETVSLAAKVEKDIPYPTLYKHNILKSL